MNAELIPRHHQFVWLFLQLLRRYCCCYWCLTEVWREKEREKLFFYRQSWWGICSATRCENKLLVIILKYWSTCKLHFVITFSDNIQAQVNGGRYLSNVIVWQMILTWFDIDWHRWGWIEKDVTVVTRIHVNVFTKKILLNSFKRFNCMEKSKQLEKSMQMLNFPYLSLHSYAQLTESEF